MAAWHTWEHELQELLKYVVTRTLQATELLIDTNENVSMICKHGMIQSPQEQFQFSDVLILSDEIADCLLPPAGK